MQCILVAVQYVLLPYKSPWWVFSSTKQLPHSVPELAHAAACINLPQTGVLGTGHVNQSLPPHFSSSLCFTGVWNRGNCIWGNPQSRFYYCRNVRALSIKMRSSSRNSIPRNSPHHKWQKSALGRINIREKENGGKARQDYFELQNSRKYQFPLFYLPESRQKPCQLHIHGMSVVSQDTGHQIT